MTVEVNNMPKEMPSSIPRIKTPNKVTASAIPSPGHTAKYV